MAEALNGSAPPRQTDLSFCSPRRNNDYKTVKTAAHDSGSEIKKRNTITSIGLPEGECLLNLSFSRPFSSFFDCSDQGVQWLSDRDVECTLHQSESSNAYNTQSFMVIF